MVDRRTLEAISRESTNARRPSRFWSRREASEPLQVGAMTVPFQVSYGLNPPSVQAGYRGGFIR